MDWTATTGVFGIPMSEPGDLITTVEYTKVLCEDEDFVIHSDELDRQRFPPDVRIVKVQDVVGKESSYSLDQHGFTWLRSNSTLAYEQDFLDEDKVRNGYVPEMERFLRDSLGASHAFVFNHFLRHEGTHPGPVPAFHLDSSIDFACTLASYSPYTRALARANIREVHVNLWRPLRRVWNSHLALLNAQSMKTGIDEVPLTFISPNPRNPQRSTHYLRYSPDHEFFYKSGMTPQDVVVFKTFDSKTDGRARRVAHGSVRDPNASADAPGRVSMELRAILFFDQDTRD